MKATAGVILALAATVACAQELTLSDPVLAAITVVEKGNAFAKNQGIDLSKYTVRSVSYNYVRRTWFLIYEGKSLIVGDHFSLQLSDDANPTIRLIPGL